jgi:hypothetical protein
MDTRESYTGIMMQISNNVRESLFNNNKILRNSIAEPSHFTYEEKKHADQQQESGDIMPN